MGAYYKKTDIVENHFYKPPEWINKDFSAVEGTDLEIQEGDRLDIIAEQVYGDPSLWKAIALCNNINYFFDIKPGMVIKLPTKIKDVTDKI